MPRQNYPTEQEWGKLIEHVLESVTPELENIQMDSIKEKLIEQIKAAGYIHADIYPSTFEQQLDLGLDE